MRKLTFFILVVLFAESTAAQSLEERYRAFQQIAKQVYSDFRDEQLPCNLSYADFLKWLSKNQIKDSQMVVKTNVIIRK